ncbi:MAG: dienelactone hydrolase family protein [Planctomycetaceae bacterium]|nr:dienelactone hydrolase family protein [Planctomycetaceae bacterium]
MSLLTLTILLALGDAPAADLVTREIEYRHGDVVLEGYVAYPKDAKGKLPGVLVCHQWMGLTPYERMRADETAKLGFVAFALDIYGKGVRPKDREEAAKMAGIYKGDRALLRARALAGLETLRKVEACDPSKIAVMGYCFGGTTALEAARSGADLAGTVSFHGDLSSPAPDDAKKIKGKVLALHGGDDPYVPPAQVAAFEEEMRKAGVDWQLVAFGGAVHAFTQKGAGNDNSKGAAYNEKADRRSWEMYKDFLAELFP